MFSKTDQRSVTHPPLATGDLPGIEGRIRTTPEDFRVAEIPAYDPDGVEGRHVLVRMRKRGWNTESATAEISRQIEVPRSEIGTAGLKDRDAVTEQWISVPWSAYARLDAFRHDEIVILEALPHSHKLRRGHLRGNRFEIVVRDIPLDGPTALERVHAKLARIRQQGGLWNLYGIQRFGHDGKNVPRGFAILESGRMRARDHLFASAAQSALFNLYLLERANEPGLRVLLPGDILQKRDTGGIFECRDPGIDQARADRNEVVVTGPIFGSKTREPAIETPSWKLETAILERGELTRDQLWALGKKAPGSRRAVTIDLGNVGVELVTPDPRPDPSATCDLRLRFVLPAGSYATQLLRELGLET